MSNDIIKTLREGQPDRIQRLIQAAYYVGCTEVLNLAVGDKLEVERKEGNVVFLRPLNSAPQ
ncbi:hypothetical protein LCGC14_1597000 [marine sediment metagenome]|uniref:Uncharacterized protein n=1 Tax=marine sediment metagenome TaxID=412755 RepID=A0A0F9LCJ9_9ZZZZ